MKSPSIVKVWLKAIIALCGGVSAWGITAAADGGISLVEIFGLVGALGTALAVAVFPNAEQPAD